MGELVNIASKLPAAMQDVFNADALAGDLYSNVQGGFSVISFRGSKWRIKHGGEEDLLTNQDGDPIAALECVIVKASPDVSKIYFESAYVEGEGDGPDCFSADGKTPDASVENPQHTNCAACPKNAFGSRINPNGKKAKACSDSRRVAIVPLGDIANEQYGGAMLMRVPATSLADLAHYGKGMAAKGFPYNAIGTRIGFDPNASYPKLTFKPIKPLTEDQLHQVAEIFQSDATHAIFNTAPAPAPAAAPKKAAPKQEAVSFDFDEEDAEPAPAPKKKAAPKAKKEPVVEKPVESSSDDLDDLLSDLDSLG